jgi:hypothetical protein
MKVGSIVECVKPSNYQTDDVHPVVGKLYTVREINTTVSPALRFEEIVNKVKLQHYGLVEEICFDIKRFREVLPAGTISLEELLEEVAPV